MPVKKSAGRKSPSNTRSKPSPKRKRSTPKSKARPVASAKKRAARKPARKVARKVARRKTARKASPSSSASMPACLTGNFDGDIRANGPVWITKSAKCNARVQAPSVQLDGTMKGTVHAKNTMKLGPQCNMHGTIVAEQLVCANGASFNGTCKIGRYRKAA